MGSIWARGGMFWGEIKHVKKQDWQEKKSKRQESEFERVECCGEHIDSGPCAGVHALLFISCHFPSLILASSYTTKNDISEFMALLICNDT